MIDKRISGMFLLPETAAPSRGRADDAGLVGIVVADPDEAVAYLDAGRVGPYVIIRTVNDVPKRLGGLAILTHEALTPAMLEALTHATLGA